MLMRVRIGIVGAGSIGGNCARQFAKGGHEVQLSGRDPAKLEPLAQEIGGAASVGTPAEAAESGEVVVLAVPWVAFTSGFQAEVAFRPEAERVAQWICGDDAEAKRVVMDLISDAGYVPVDVGSNADAAVMEAPRRAGAVYGKEYRLPDAEKVVEAIQAGDQIPATPAYS
jgi:8-hydroxy-5-deazaflavin:NADPH oxidoreductase